ncbi:hypothetical protein [Myxococcus sp. AB036A]|uniref:hypothetical protein n=1 Tax=Myxococcus sp. AB036A TaxID=2562793 RepID=UPI001E3B9151|nr:hypothetical protein [Myxococcus sp. AB036A]
MPVIDNLTSFAATDFLSLTKEGEECLVIVVAGSFILPQPAMIPLPPKKNRATELVALLKSKDVANKGAITAELKPLQAEINEAEEQIKKQRAEDRLEVLEMAKANAQVEGMQPVLRFDDASKTFLNGYMTGVCICKCPQKAKMLAACSGDAAPGFKEAVASTPFELVESFQKSES